MHVLSHLVLRQIGTMQLQVLSQNLIFIITFSSYKKLLMASGLHHVGQMLVYFTVAS